MQVTIPRLLLTAPVSGSGKTTLTCALMRALSRRGVRIAAFKSGPDYIDPMFHTKVLGLRSRNLDLFLCGEEMVRRLFARNVSGMDLAILEGAMGYYDGMGRTTEASAYALARTVSAPAVLIVNARGGALSIGAVIKGFREYRSDSNICGAILNNVSKMTYMFYKDVLEKESGVKLFGYFPRMENCGFESRHLGLVTAGEISGLEKIINRLADAAEECLDLDGLLEAAHGAKILECPEWNYKPVTHVRLALALDEAFCFYYQDALDLLAALGAEIIPFSPLHDSGLPECDGVYLGGGYPELYPEQLEANATMRSSLKLAIKEGLPTYAECGGFMYLQEHLRTCGDAADLSAIQNMQREYNWVGAIPGTVSMTKKLQRFGYVYLTAGRDNVFGNAGACIPAHEFHYSDSTNNGDAFKSQKASGRLRYECGHASQTLYAGYPHLHLCGAPDWAENFVMAMKRYRYGRK